MKRPLPTGGLLQKKKKAFVRDLFRVTSVVTSAGIRLGKEAITYSSSPQGWLQYTRNFAVKVKVAGNQVVSRMLSPYVAPTEKSSAERSGEQGDQLVST